MVKFTTIVKKFKEKGEKSGWTYIEIPTKIAEQIKPNSKKSFRVKGFLNTTAINKIALLPMGEGNFILPLNLQLRKNLQIRTNDAVLVEVELDNTEYQLNADLVECLGFEPKAAEFFYKMPKSHQNYYSKWIEQAKSPITISNRISKTINGLLKQLSFADTIKQKD